MILAVCIVCVTWVKVTNPIQINMSWLTRRLTVGQLAANCRSTVIRLLADALATVIPIIGITVASYYCLLSFQNFCPFDSLLDLQSKFQKLIVT